MKFVYSERSVLLHARTHVRAHTPTRTHARARTLSHARAHAHMEIDEPKMEGKMERRTGGEEDRETDSPEIIIKSQRDAGGR